MDPIIIDFPGTSYWDPTQDQLDQACNMQVGPDFYFCGYVEDDPIYASGYCCYDGM